MIVKSCLSLEGLRAPKQHLLISPTVSHSNDYKVGVSCYAGRFSVENNHLEFPIWCLFMTSVKVPPGKFVPKGIITPCPLFRQIQDEHLGREGKKVKMIFLGIMGNIMIPLTESIHPKWIFRLFVPPSARVIIVSL